VNKPEFFNRLLAGIHALPFAERNEIKSDYEEHFARGMESGQSEEEICALLGDPEAIANDFMSDYYERTGTSPASTPPAGGTSEPQSNPQLSHAAIIALLVILNVCVVLPAVASVLGIALGFILASIALIVAGICLFFVAVYPAVMILTGIGLIALGVLFALLTYLAGKGIHFLGREYILWNKKLIREGK